MKLVGWYANTDQLYEHPETLDILAEAIGLNMVIIGGNKLSEEAQRLNPYPTNAELRGPGVTWSADDSKLLAVMREARERGLEVWTCLGSYCGQAEEFPELGLHILDMEGQPIDERYHTYGVSFCPNNEKVDNWFRAYYCDVAVNYDFDGFTLTHVRYSPPGNFQNLFACACPNCQRATGEMGYDFPRMRKSVLRFLKGIRSLDADRARRLSELNLSFFDFLTYFDHDGALIDWFSFRAESISNRVKGWGEAVREVAKKGFTYGTDIFAPTFAILVGHRYRKWEEGVDFISTLLPHVEFFFTACFAEYANLLTQWAKGLTEAEALKLVYRLFNYDRFNMPLTIDYKTGRGRKGLPMLKLPFNEVPVGDMVELEIRKSKIAQSGRLPSYPCISAGWDPATVGRLVRATRDVGHDGIIFQAINIDNKPVLNAIGEAIHG